MFTLVLEKDTLDIIENSRGKMDSYVTYTRWNIKKYIENGDEIPKGFTSMWY